MRKLIACSAVALALLFTFSPVAKAVEYGGIGGRPANPKPGNSRSKSIFIFELKPGQSASDGVKIFNNTGQERTVSVYPVDSVLSSGGAFACAQKVVEPQDVGSWVSLESNQVTVDANDSATVSFTVTLPSSVDVGEHNGCIAIQDVSAQKESTDTNGVVLSFRSAIRMAVTVPGDIEKGLDLKDLQVGKLDDNQYTVSPTLENTGNVSLDTDIKVGLTSLLGAESGNASGTYPILPQSEASWNFDLDRPFWGGFYRAKAVATYDSNPSSGIGQSANDKPVTIEKTSAVFFVPPEPLAFIIELLALLVVLTGVYLLIRKRRQARHVKKHWQTYTVKGHESLASIAKRHKTSWKQLAKANKLKPPFELEDGQQIKVPASKKEQ